MENQQLDLEQTVGTMHRRQEKMADGVRDIIYYTFGDADAPETANNASQHQGRADV